jgi:hypothetical protein
MNHYDVYMYAFLPISAHRIIFHCAVLCRILSPYSARGMARANTATYTPAWVPNALT